MEIKILKDILDVNNTVAEENRKFFLEKGVFVLNLMSSPGSGKTTTLEKTLAKINSKIPAAVIVGDICTTNDAERLSIAGTPVIQINTDNFGGECHLAAHVIRKAADSLDLDSIKLLIIENIGNLVCPAEFDIGEDMRGVVLSVTEGEDKPLKYPLMFRVCDFALLNKIDLLPYLEFDKEKTIENIHAVHPEIPVFEISATKGHGFDNWIEWLCEMVENKLNINIT